MVEYTDGHPDHIAFLSEGPRSTGEGALGADHVYKVDPYRILTTCSLEPAIDKTPVRVKVLPVVKYLELDANCVHSPDPDEGAAV